MKSELGSYLYEIQLANWRQKQIRIRLWNCNCNTLQKITLNCIIHDVVVPRIFRLDCRQIQKPTWSFARLEELLQIVRMYVCVVCILMFRKLERGKRGEKRRKYFLLLVFSWETTKFLRTKFLNNWKLCYL